MKQLVFFALILLLHVSSVFAEVTGCDKLSVRDCFTTKGCFLDCENIGRNKCAPYHCRAAKNLCESRFAQAELKKEDCESLARCVYQAAACFCPGPMQCVCGGGPPAQCREADFDAMLR